MLERLLFIYKVQPNIFVLLMKYSSCIIETQEATFRYKLHRTLLQDEVPIYTQEKGIR